MAGQNPNLSDDTTKIPHEAFLLRFGPWSHGAGNGAVALGLAHTVNNDLGYITDRPIVVDNVTASVMTKPTAYRGIRLGWATSGQTKAAAVTAGQFFTSEFDLNTLTNDTPGALTVTRTNNVIPAGSRLFYTNTGNGAGGDTTDTALVQLVIMVRGSTRVL